MEFSHKSVLLNECIENLNIKAEGLYIDGTLGGAGHSLEICKKFGKNGKLIGIDRDMEAIQKAKDVLKDFSENVIFENGNFNNIKSIIKKHNFEQSGVDGILIDLGVSSYQLDNAERGFSYMSDAPLDMRMDSNSNLTAYDIVNEYNMDDLTGIILKHSEERWAKRIAQFIIEARTKKPIETTYELVDLIKAAIPKSARSDGPHPAKRTFQAIRIEVNNELSELEKAIEDMADTLKPSGRLCIISFHSLEDRIVKNTFKKLENPCTCPSELPICVCKKQSTVKIVSRKPILPSELELNENPRARSAKLRVIKKL